MVKRKDGNSVDAISMLRLCQGNSYVIRGWRLPLRLLQDLSSEPLILIGDQRLFYSGSGSRSFWWNL
jgi:hypothetical protein